MANHQKPNYIDVPAVHNALFGTKLYINRQLSELLTFRQRYESREECDANKNKIQLVAHEPKVVTPQQFLNCAIKKLVRSIRETELTPNVLSMHLFIASSTKVGGHTLAEKCVAKKLNLLQPKGHILLGLNIHGGVPSTRVKNKFLLVKRMLTEINEEAMKDGMETPATLIKSTKVLDLSITRRLHLETPSDDCIGSSSVHTSGSEKKSQRTVKRSIVVIDLSDSEYDTKDDEKEPNAKKPMVTMDQDAIAQMAIVTIKKEKDVEQNVEKDE
ncbi:hypothetical protein Tco_0348335 [Tanacetum coccineum]